MDFTIMDAGTIMSGTAKDGARYLELFLKEYSKLFSTTVNPGCNKCIAEYLTKYKAKMKKSTNNSGYVLLEKYNGLMWPFGSQQGYTNDTITAKQGKYLLDNHPKGAGLFEKIPSDTESSADDLTEEQKLEANVKKAQDAVDNLKQNSRKTTKEAAHKALDDAKKALADYQATNAGQKAPEEFEVVLTEDHFEDTEELTEAGYAVGDIVIATHNEDGETLNIIRKAEKE